MKKRGIESVLLYVKLVIWTCDIKSNLFREWGEWDIESYSVDV